MDFCLSKLVSKVWEKYSPNFLYIYKVKNWKKVGIILLFILGHFSFVSNAASSFIL